MIGMGDSVCIVTVYNSINIGSFWQAYALQSAIENLGYNVFFYKNPEYKRIILKEIKISLSLIIRRGCGDGLKYFFSVLKFIKAQKKFIRVISDKYKIWKDIHRVIIGSDTVWNIDDDFFRRNVDIFWGSAFSNKCVITYAASVSKTEYDKFKLEEYTNALNNLDSISVRDLQTYNIVKMLTSERDVSIVCDPTVLFDKEYYDSISKNATIHICKPYILLYLFEPLSEKHQSEIAEFAKKDNLEIISAYGRGNAGIADAIYYDDPFSFIQHLIHASYVVTDTFHGTIFSINFNKQFCTINRGKNPPNDAMHYYGLDDWLIGDDISVINALKNAIDINALNAKLKTVKEDSYKYLVNAVTRKWRR